MPIIVATSIVLGYCRYMNKTNTDNFDANMDNLIDNLEQALKAARAVRS